MSDSVRDYLATELTPLLPASWRIIPEQRMPQTLDTITVVLKHRRIERLAEAPVGNLRNEVVLTVVDPHEDWATAEDALDDAVNDVLTALDGHSQINWTLAEKVAVSDTYIGWDLTLTVITSTKE